jgi:outer membrane protein insertion porin family
MKKMILFVLVFIVAISAFSITRLTEINYNTDISYAENEISKILRDYDVEVGNLVIDLDIRLAIAKINELGFFTSTDYNFNKENGVLDIIFTPNPIIKDIQIKILGAELLKTAKLKESVYDLIPKNTPLNLQDYQKALVQINQMYNAEGYQFISIESNITVESNRLKLIPTDIKNNSYDENTLVFIITEYTLWDIELKGEFAQLNSKDIKKKTGFKFAKDREEAFFLFKTAKKDTYPSVTSIQNIFSSLREIPFFGENTEINFAPIEIEDFEGGALVLVISGVMPKVVSSDVSINEVTFSGNNVIQDFRLNDEVKKTINLDEPVSNFQILASLENIQKKYKTEGYIFVEVIPQYSNNILNFEITEYKVGEIIINKEEITKTKDYIIDSLNILKSNEVVNQNNLKDVYTSYMGTGFFENVDIYPSNISGEYVDFMIVPYENLKPGKFLGGVTWTMPNDEEEPWYKGFSGQLEVSWPNLGGIGQTIGINSEIIPLQQVFSLGVNYKIIKLFETNLDLETSFKYTLAPNGLLDMHLGEKVTNLLSVNISPRYKFNDFSYVTSSASYDNYTTLETDDLESKTLNRLSGSAGYLFNKVDSPFRPYNGEFLYLRGLGGVSLPNFDNYYLGASLEVKYFNSFYKFTSGTRLKGAYTHDTADLYSYFLGKYTGVRGYEYKTKEGDNLLLFNQELAYELTTGAVPSDLYIFFDWGNATNNFNFFENSIWSFGAGIKVTVPLLGPIRFEYVFDKDLKGKFEFAFGTVF